MTPGNLISLLLRTAQINGVGQNASAEDNNEMMLHLNMLLGQWSAMRTMVYHLVNTSVVATGASSYTVGTGGNFNTTRPDKIDAAFFTNTSVTPNIDTPLGQIGTREEWNSIANKSITTANMGGGWFFYDSGYLLGTLYPYPIPTTGSLTISTKDVLVQFADLVTDIALPPAYLNALLWNGASVARTAFGLGPDGAIEKRAAGALEVIRAANRQVPMLQMPAGLLRGRGRYNIFTDAGGWR